MSESTTLLSLRATLSGRWQLPALCAGLLLFGASLAKMVREHHSVHFEDELAFVRTLRTARAHDRASAYILAQLTKPERPVAQRAELTRQFAHVIYDVESELTVHRADNARAIISNLKTAQRLGAEPTREDWLALADAHEWVGDRIAAIAAIREALSGGAPNANKLRRRLFDLYSAPQTTQSEVKRCPPDALALLADVMESPDAGPVEQLWALENEVNDLLAANEVNRARSRLESWREKFQEPEHLARIALLDARCLYQAGRTVAAESALRFLRDTWKSRDDLWARSGWLLGSIELEDGRPQSALAFFDDVLRSFPLGGIRNDCALGRAECLSSLDRHEEALAELNDLASKTDASTEQHFVDHDILQTTAASTGQRLLAEKELEFGVRYLEFALAHAPASNRRVWLLYTTRLADAYCELAARVDLSDERKSACLSRVAETNLALAEADELDDVAAARAMDRAVAAMQAPSQRERLIKLLDRYTAKHVDSLWRSTALFKLAQALQAQGRYDEAATAYQDVIHTYPRMPDSLKSFVPLADCLLAESRAGGGNSTASRKRGVELLLDIVDDRGREHIFGPASAEYHDALLRLALYYSDVTDAEQAGHEELAAARWQQWLALYPDDPQIPMGRFMLAEALRRSAARLRDEAKSLMADDQKQKYLSESTTRLEQAQSEYALVVSILSKQAQDSLTDADRSRLRAACLFRADCVFDMGRLADALTAYREAAWRYQDEPIAVTAALQVVHCLERLGRQDEAAQCLARAKWLLARIPSASFEALPGSPSKNYYKEMLDRVERARVQ